MLAWSPWAPAVLAHAGRPEVEWVKRHWSWSQAALDVACVIPGALWVFAGAPLRDGPTLTTVAVATTAAWIGGFERPLRARVLGVVLAAGLAGSAFVVSGTLVPQPGEPGRAADRMIRGSRHPAMWVWSYAHLNDVSAGLALALPLMKLDPRTRVRLVADPEFPVDAAVGRYPEPHGRVGQPRHRRAAAGRRRPPAAAEPRVRVHGTSLYHLVCE